MDGSSSNPGPLNSSLPPPTFYQVPPAPGYHWQDHLLVPSSVSALPPIPPPLPISSPPRYHQLPSYHQLYNHTAVHYAPPFPPALGSLADSIQQQPRITQGPFSYLPQWQPDHLVRNCPICDTLFTLFFRRHHCRKCGRVVCAQCSPNRLTLASSAVVRPPGEVTPTQGLDTLGLPSSAHWGGLLGGSFHSPPASGTSNRHSWVGSVNTPGEQNSIGFFDWRANEDPPPGMEDVRVCCDCFAGNSPAQNGYRSVSGSSTSIHRTWNGSSSPTRPSASELWTPPPGVSTLDINRRRRRQSLQGARSLPYNYDPSTPSRQNSASYVPQCPASGSNYTFPPTVPTPQAHHNPAYSLPPQLQAKYASYFTTRERVFGLSGSSSPHRQSSAHMPHNNASHSNAPQPQHTSHHPQPCAPPGSSQAKLKETDYCPICTLPLPPPHPETGDESARETHIQDCIRSHEASSSPHSRSNNPLAAAFPADARGLLGSTPAGMNMMDFLRQSGVTPAQASGRMVVYKAREEDTWDYSSEDEKGGAQNKISSSNSMVIDLTGDNELPIATVVPLLKGKCRKKAECVICFEEFEIGELIARLECLCRYHKSCIREWFDRKGNGDCPVHAVRD